MTTVKTNLPEFRLSLAAVGRRLSSVILRANAGELSDENFFDTITAVFNSCISEETTSDPEANIDSEILSAEQAEIEKSVRRSQAAREAARRRREKSSHIHSAKAPEREARESQDGNDNPPLHSAPKKEVGAAQCRSVTSQVHPAAEDADLPDEPEEIVESKYDAYGARRRPY